MGQSLESGSLKIFLNFVVLSKIICHIHSPHIGALTQQYKQNGSLRLIWG
jgi:hypothetical protein